MPYIHCERCGTSCYSNVLSCPRCRLPVQRVHAHAVFDDEAGFSARDEEVETEVRDALYGWHSGCVERRPARDHAGLATTSRSAPS